MAALHLPRGARGRRIVRLLDAAFLVWALLWLGAGVLVARDLYRLRQVSDTLDSSAQALDRTGQALHKLDSIPLIGGDIGQVGNRVEDAAVQTRESARRSRASITELSWLLGFCIVLIPAVPAAAVWVPYRLRRRHERQALRRAFQRGDVRVREHLARRALLDLSYDELVGVSPDPWADVDAGRYDALADLELQRLGFDERLGALGEPEP